MPVSTKKNPISQFAAKRSEKHLKSQQKEMSQIIAVTAKEILQEVQKNPAKLSFHGSPCRGLLAWTLRNAVRQGMIT